MSKSSLYETKRPAKREIMGRSMRPFDLGGTTCWRSAGSQVTRGGAAPSDRRSESSEDGQPKTGLLAYADKKLTRGGAAR